MKKLFATFLAMAMIICLLAGCGSNNNNGETANTTPATTPASNAANSSSDLDPIYIGLSAKITGADAANGDRMVKAATMAVDEINAGGGLLGGRMLELVIEDDGTDNTMAVNVANIFAANSKISAVVGPWNSGQIMASESVYKEAGIPFFGLGTNPTLKDLGNEYCFLVRGSDTIMASCAAELVIGELKATKVGIMYTTNEFGTGAMEVIQQSCTAAGLEVYPEAINVGDTDVTGQILDMKNKGVDCMVVWASDAEYVLTARQAFELGLDVPVVASPAITMDQVRELCEPDWVEGWYAITDFVSNSTDETVLDFCNRYAEGYGEGQNAELYVADVYSTVMLIADAIERAGSADREAIRNAVEQTVEFPMLQGMANCDATHSLIHSACVAQVVDYTPVQVNTVSVDF